MKHPVLFRFCCAAVLAILILAGSGPALAQMAGAPVSAAGADIVRIRKLMQPEKLKTPVFRTAVQSTVTAKQPDWWRVAVEYETAPDWIDELEFTYYAYIEDQSNRGTPVMFRTSVTYVNVPKGRHMSDVFLHPNTILRMGLVKQIAVVIKHRGATVATESTATKPNWWDGYAPVDGVLLNRAQTPFAYVDYDVYEQIKPTAAGR